jgi:hypothetical protein
MRLFSKGEAEGVPTESIGLLAGRLNVLLEGALVRAWMGDALGLTNAVDVFVERVDDAGESDHAAADTKNRDMGIATCHVLRQRLCC